MSSAIDRRFWALAQRRAQGLNADMRAAVIRAFQIIRDSLTDAQIEALIQQDQLSTLFRQALDDDLLDRAFLPVREEIRNAIERGFNVVIPALPKAGQIDRVVAVAFDYLAPNVVEGIRALESKVITTLKDDTAETVRAFVENGIRDGKNPKVIGRQLRSVVGLAPSQLQEVENYRRALEDGDAAKALTYRLRDKRFDAATKSGTLSAEKIATAVDRYCDKRIAWNAETNARTATMDAMKLGQRLNIDDAVARGIMDPATLVKRWIGVKDSRERPEHLSMEGETVGYDEPFSNGEDTPGDSTFNCRCVARYFQQKPQPST